MKIYDISIPLKKGMIVYPKNPRFNRKEIKGSSINSELTIGTHTGAHVDAPKHVFPKKQSIDKMKLDSFIGPCRVLNCTKSTEAVSLADIQKHNVKKGERILLKTRNSLRSFSKFRSDFIYLSGEASEYLAKKGIALIGIDYLSIKKRGGSDNRPHTEFLKRGIPILEGINLKNVRAGRYTLSALPLRIVDGDGSPVRAVLIQ